MSMDTETPDLQALLQAARGIESSREILGSETVNGLIGEIRDRALESLAQPDETQLSLRDSWQSTVLVMESIGLDAGEPSEEVQEAIDIVNAYKEAENAFSILSNSVGAVATSTELEPVEEKIELEQEHLLKPEVTGSTAEALRHRPVHLRMTEKGSEVIIDGEVTRKFNDEWTEKCVSILLELENGENELKTSEYLISNYGHTIITVRKELAKYQSQKPEQLLHAYADIRQFYNVLEAMKETGIVEHRKGSYATAGRVARTGVITLNMPVSIDEELLSLDQNSDQQNLSELILDRYLRTLSIGRDVVQIKASEVGVKMMALLLRSIGDMAITGQEEGSSRQSMTDVYRRANDLAPSNGQGEAITRSEAIGTMKNIISILARFGEDSPLAVSGARTAITYRWMPGIVFVETDTMPKKPNFDDELAIEIDGDKIYVILDGARTVLEDVSALAAHQRFRGKIDTHRILTTDRKLLEALTTLVEATDEATTSMFVEMVLDGGNYSKAEWNYVAKRLTGLIKKLNEISKEKVVNVRRFSDGNIYDLNRRIVILSTEGEAIVAQEPIKPTAPQRSTRKTEHQTEIDPNLPVQPRKDAEDLFKGADSLDEMLKKTITGKVIHGMRVDYPKTLEEAAFLLQTLTDPVVLAATRNSARFSRTGHSDFQNFISESLLKVFLRTKTWGDFDDLIRITARQALGRSEDKLVSEVTNSARRMARDPGQSLTTIDTSAEKSVKNYVERLTIKLIEDKTILSPSSPQQAIALLDTIRLNREDIVRGMTQQEFDELIQEAHSALEKRVGQGSKDIAIENRRSRHSAKGSSGNGRAIQVGGRDVSEHSAIARTDLTRYPERIIP